MLIVQFKMPTRVGSSSPRYEHDWHIGEAVNFGFSDVELVQADGDELDYIHHLFGSTIPQPKVRVAVYTGDIAKMIVANLGQTIITE